MRVKKIILTSCLSIAVITIISLILLAVLAGRERVGYIGELKLDLNETILLNAIDKDINIYKENNYNLQDKDIEKYIFNNFDISNFVYRFKFGYYNKVFKHSDIYGVYPIFDNLPQYIKKIKQDKDGDPFGFLISSKKLGSKIDNIIYSLKVKNGIIFISVLIFSIIFILVFVLNLILKKKDIRFSFCLIMTILFLIFLVLLITDKNRYQLNIVLNGWDLFADFYNVLRYINERNPYFNAINGLAEKNYFPLPYLILYPFSLFKDYSVMSLGEIQADPISNISLVVFLSFSILLLFLYVHKIDKKEKYSNYIIILMFFSSNILFTIERANAAILASAFAAIFLALYKSENRFERIVSLIALGCASALKVYPVLLGFLLLQERRYKDIIYGSIITLSLVFLPFLFFEHGFRNIPRLILNLKEWKNIYNATGFGRFGLSHLIYLLTHNSSASFIFKINLITYILIFISIIYSFFIKEYWKKVCILSIITIQFPVTGYYCAANIYPAIILFLNKKFEKIDIVFLVLFCIYLMPIQIPGIGSYIVASVTSIIIWFMILFETIIKNTYRLKNYLKNINSLKNDIIGVQKY